MNVKKCYNQALQELEKTKIDQQIEQDEEEFDKQEDDKIIEAIKAKESEENKDEDDKNYGTFLQRRQLFTQVLTPFHVLLPVMWCFMLSIFVQRW